MRGFAVDEPSDVLRVQNPFADHEVPNLLVGVGHRFLTGDLTSNRFGDVAAVDRLSRVVMLGSRTRYGISTRRQEPGQERELLDRIRVFQDTDSSRRNVLVEQQALLLLRRREPEDEVERGVDVLASLRDTEQPVAGHVRRLDALLRRLRADVDFANHLGYLGIVDLQELVWPDVG